MGCIAADVSTVADFLNSENKLHKLQPTEYQDLVVDLGYRLLEYEPLDGEESQYTLHTVLHLALTAFMTTFILQFGHKRRIRFQNLAVHLKEALNKPWTCEPANRTFLLWAAVIGGIAEIESDDHPLLLAEIKRMADGLGIHDWESLQRVLLQYPWVRVLHDESARKIWESASTI